jgi:hypothetical protein
MIKHIYGTIVDYETVGTTVNGNPIVDVSVESAHGDPEVRRVSHDSALAYDVRNHREEGAPRAYVLTGAGRVSHEDMDVTNAYQRLYRAFPRGARVTTIVTHVSASGMSRRFRVLAARSSRTEGAWIDDVTLSVARVIGWKATDRGELVVSGAGMDMGFHAVYTLASRLYGDGYALNHRGI